MAHLLDSDTLIDYFANAPDIVALIDSLIPTGIAVSIITYMELYQGVLRGTADAAQLQAFIETVPPLPISVAVAQRCAQLRETLAAQSRRVRPRALDLLIAATALEYGLTLVTANTDDYRDIPGLALLNPRSTPSC
jgi:predicted nucleic acid-binding protein